MGKKILIILINIVIFLLFLFGLNWVIYKYFYNGIEFNQHSLNKRPFNLVIYNPTLEWINDSWERRPYVGTKYKNKGIIISGCSYGFGAFLEENQTFHYKLSERLKRPVYNLAVSGQSTQFLLMKIQSHLYDDIIKNSDYLIEVTIGEHVWRTHTYSNGWPTDHTWPRYDKRNGKLVFHEAKLPWLEGSYLYKYFQKIFFAKILTPLKVKFVQDYLFDFMKLHYETIRDELHKINPDIKMVILVYHDESATELFTSSSRWRELEDEGFIVIDVNKALPQLSTERRAKYMIPNDGHPNEAAWNLITDYIINDLKLFDSSNKNYNKQ